jgi:two-component system phosphate regulon response regulator PhoB
MVDVGGLQLDPTTHKVSRHGKDAKVGPTEFRLLHYMMTHPERVHSRSQLLNKVWGDQVAIEERTIDVHVKRLREALGTVQCAAMVDTVRGIGYRFTAQPTGVHP